MVAMTPDAFVAHLGALRASAILRTDTQQAAGPAMDAAIRAGFRIVEFTMTTPGALDRIAEFARQPDIIVGAGTILSVEQARDAVDAGARFLVSPVMDPEVIAEATRLGVAIMPGCHTPTEMHVAHRAGAQLVKLFPPPGVGPDYVRAILGPMPFLRIVPTSGVTATNVQAYLGAGAYAVGFVSLFDPDEVRHGKTERIEARARQLLRLVNSA